MRISERLSIVTISSLTHKLILLLMVINVMVLAFLPWLVSLVISVDLGNGYRSLYINKPLYYYFIILLYIVSFIALIILNDLRLLFKSCVLENIFIQANTKRLARMGASALSISLVFMTKIFIVNSIMTMVVVFSFFMASIFCLVLTLLFDQAVHYKEENDLTI